MTGHKIMLTFNFKTKTANTIGNTQTLVKWSQTKIFKLNEEKC